MFDILKGSKYEHFRLRGALINGVKFLAKSTGLLGVLVLAQRCLEKESLIGVQSWIAAEDDRFLVKLFILGFFSFLY
jgi:hypothetical protein